MKNLYIILFSIYLFIFALNSKATAADLEDSSLKGTVSVFYDKSGKKYIYVKSYTRKDGTVVKGYYRSVPDKDKNNNWSAKGNINPFTGKKGYEQ